MKRQLSSEKALFLIDKTEIMAWSYLSFIGENLDTHSALDALEKLSVQEKILANRQVNTPKVI